MPKADPPKADPPKAERRVIPALKPIMGKAARRLVVLAVVFMAVVGGLGLLAERYAGRAFVAPDWLRARIEARIARELPQAKVSFGEMVLIVDEGWRPRVRLRDVKLTSQEGRHLLGFAEFKAGLAMRPLLRGQVQPRQIALTGVFVTLRRDENGRMAIIAGPDPSITTGEAASVPELLGRMDAMFSAPLLSELRLAEVRALTLRYEDVRQKKAWTVDGGRLVVDRRGDDLSLSADLAVLSGGAGVATVSARYDSTIGDTAAGFGITFQDVAAEDIAAQGPAFAWLGALRAPISGAVRGGFAATGDLAPLNATLQIGAGVVQPNAAASPIPFDSARSYFSYLPRKALLRFDELSVQSKWVSGRLEGEALLGGLTGGTLEDMVGQLRVRDVLANPRDLYAEPVRIDAAELDFKLTLAPFRLQLGRVQVTDQGQTLLASGDLRASPEGWRLGLDGRLDGTGVARVLALWPERLVPKVRRWLEANIHTGRLRDIDVALRRSPDAPPQTYVGFSYAGAEVKFLKTLPPVREASGRFTLMQNRMVVALDAGHVMAPQGGKVALAGTSFIIPDVTVRGGTPAEINVITGSKITAALALLDLPPLAVMQKAGQAVDVADGEARLQGRVTLPLSRKVKPGDVRFEVTGQLRNVTTDTLIKGRSLQADILTLKVTNTGVEIAGKGRFDGAPFDAAWAQPIGKGAQRSTVSGTAQITAAALDKFGVALPPGMVAGQGTAAFDLTLERGVAPKLAVTSDLRGLRLAVPQISWRKGAQTRGALAMDVTLGTPPKVNALTLEAAGLRVAGDVTLRADGTLERVTFDRVRVNDWLDVPVTLLGQGAGRPVAVQIGGGSLDLRRATFGGTPDGAAPAGPPMQLRLDRLQITDAIALTGMCGTFKTGGGLDGAFTARINGVADVSGLVIPQNGRSAVQVKSSDAGQVFAATGVLKQAVGGDLTLTLVPVGADGVFDGTLRVTQTRIKDAPAIAALLNALSVVGLLEQMNGEGIYFSEVDGKFRLTPSKITVTQGSAVGSSMGLSMDGIYNVKAGVLDMQGVISPIYLLNGIGAVLTRKGEGLIGFNYRLSGPAASPRVAVNPLSALTPGMFREIFRKAPPKVANHGPPTEIPEALRDATPSQGRGGKPVADRHEGR